MKGFEIKSEKRKTFAAKFAVVAALTSLLGIASYAAARRPVSNEPLGGVTMPYFIEPAQAVEILDARLKQDLGIVMEHDVRVSFSNGTTNIDFIADGNNNLKKISYDLVGYGYYNGDERDYLTSLEESYIRGFRAGDHYIILIELYDEDEVNRAYNAFILAYTNRR
jgi:hypothetical protein